MGQASRVMARQRFFNVVVTNVPGPQIPLYLAGRRMIDTFPMVPLAKNQALGIALLSYAGRINFGLVGDYDLMWDLDDFADDVRESLAELAAEAGVELTVGRQPRPGGACVRDRLAECARDLGIEVQVQRLEASTRHGRGRRDGRGLPGGRDREVDRVRGRRRPGGLRGLRAAPGGHREGGRRARRGRGPPGPGRRGPRRHRLRDRRRAAVRARPPRSCSTRRSWTTSASGRPRATRTASSAWTRASWRAACARGSSLWASSSTQVQRPVGESCTAGA